MVRTKPGDCPNDLQLFNRICKGDFIRACCAGTIASTAPYYHWSGAGGETTDKIEKINSFHEQARRTGVTEVKGASPPNDRGLGLRRILRLDATRNLVGISNRLLGMRGFDAEKVGETQEASARPPLNNRFGFARVTGRAAAVDKGFWPEAKATTQTLLQQEVSAFSTQNTTDRRTMVQPASPTMSHQIGHTYDNVTTMDNVIQGNGDVGRGDRGTLMTNTYRQVNGDIAGLDDRLVMSLKRHDYAGVIVVGKGRQVNGDILDSHTFTQFMRGRNGTLYRISSK
ncbi:hypothetical protein FGG08_005993 [Glutinoglossum americanum]|uniref:Uncharacterized protein n=1 Tax=Glutinoglossum americanum TaxID=1670608 RepID=A0A9P8I1U1_9PEZI|nr:hypothetical protein FGG08_005993 [Glutinoglossum americanum]